MRKYCSKKFKELIIKIQDVDKRLSKMNIVIALLAFNTGKIILNDLHGWEWIFSLLGL